MPVERSEGDFLIKSKDKEIMRVHFTDESMMIYYIGTVMVIDISEAKELYAWIGRRLDEEI